MNVLRTSVVAAVSTFALSVTAPAIADEPTSDPCAQQQAQYDRATAKHAALTEKWEKHPTKANKKAKKAQMHRVAKADARLDACLAEQESTPA